MAFHNKRLEPLSAKKGFTGAQYAEAYQRLGTYDAVAREFGVDPSGVRRAILRLKIDPAIEASMQAAGTNLVPKLAWAKTKSEDGTSYSVLLKPQEPQEDPEALAARIADRINAIVPTPAIQRPRHASPDLLNFIPWFDVHMGMRVGGYGTAQAVERLRDGTRDVMDRAPPAETLIIVCGGDFTEANDNAALTPANKHPLAVDIEFDDLADIAVDVTIDQIEYGLTKADRVIYQPLKANHDPAMALILRQAVRQRYRDNPRFVLKDGFDVFSHEWEGNLIAAIHGHQKVTKPELLALAIATRHAKAWGDAKRRELWRGHNHKELTISVPGMRLYQVNPICPPGRYSNENLFTGESDIQCVTYGKGGGRRATTVHIFEDSLAP